MAHTFRLNWFRKLLSSCSSSRKYRHIDDSHPIGSHMNIKDSNGGSGKVPQHPEQTPSTAPRPPKLRKCPAASALKMHPVVRNLNNLNKQKLVLPFGSQKPKRNEQLAKRLEPKSSVPSRPITLKIFTMQEQDVRDSVVTKNIANLVNQRVKDRFKKREPTVDVRKMTQKKPGVPGKDKAVKGLTKKDMGLGNIASQECSHKEYDVRFSRNQNRLEYNAKRYAASSRPTDDPNSQKLQARHDYRMQIARLQAQNVSKDNRKKTTKDIKKTTKPRPIAAASKLVKEEQKRLDILRAEWVQLKGLENAARLKRNAQPKELNKPTDPEPTAPTNLDLATLIVDPKSFLTKVHVKSKILNVGFSHSLLLDSTEACPGPTKGTSYSKPDDELPTTSAALKEFSEIYR